MQGAHACVCGTCAPFAVTKCFCGESNLRFNIACAAPDARRGGRELARVAISSKNMNRVPMLVAADAAAAAASADTYASWRRWRAIAMGETPSPMKEVGEVLFAVRCAEGSGMQRVGPLSCILHNWRILTCRI